MATATCERCGYTAGATAMGRNCPRCAEKAVRAQMRRFAAIQARHLRELRTGGSSGIERRPT
jgi:hypothetical protein